MLNGQRAKSFDFYKVFQVVIDVVGYVGRPLLFMFDKSVIKVVKGRKLLKKGHELIVRTVTFDSLVVLGIECVGIVNQTRQWP